MAAYATEGLKIGDLTNFIMLFPFVVAILYYQLIL